MNLRPLLLTPALLGTVALAVPAQAAAPVTVKTILLRGTPVGGESLKHEGITASFFLTSNPLSTNVKVTIAGRKTTTKKVGKNSSTFYVSALPKHTALAWSHTYKVKVCVKGSPCRTQTRLLPRPGL